MYQKRKCICLFYHCIMFKTSRIIQTRIYTLKWPFSELCSGCTIDGGLGYANHPSRCDRFVVCFPGKGGSLVPIEQECPYGLFWSQNALTCRLPKDATCAYGESRCYITRNFHVHVLK